MKKLLTLIVAFVYILNANAQLTGDDVISYIGTESATIASIYGPYDAENVTYKVRKYIENATEYVDVEVPTVIFNIGWAGIFYLGNLTAGGYTVTHLQYNASKGGYYKDYSKDGLTMYVMTDGTLKLDKDYDLTGDITLSYSADGKSITVVSNPKPGSMPMTLQMVFNPELAEISDVQNSGTQGLRNSGTFSLSGQRVNDNAKGLLIINGKKVVR